jgi:hypothetical protein
MPTSIHLKGGLGNQLFQLFTAIAYACKNKHKIALLNAKTLGGEAGNTATIRPTYWDTLFKSLQPFLINDYTQIQCAGSIQYNESAFTYSEIAPYNPNYLVLLSGYFQSPQYFNSHASTIIRMLNLKAQQDAACAKLSITDWSNTVALHIRLGDYKKYPNYHPIMPVTYYVNALRDILQNTMRARAQARTQTIPFRVFCFCDTTDPADAKTLQDICFHLRETFFETDFIFEPVDGALSDWEQLLFMSTCMHHIIANSSFSWWGAYLSQTLATSSSKGVICYPAVWFGRDAKHDTRDLCPSTWHRILTT